MNEYLKNCGHLSDNDAFKISLGSIRYTKMISSIIFVIIVMFSFFLLPFFHVYRFVLIRKENVLFTCLLRFHLPAMG